MEELLVGGCVRAFVSEQIEKVCPHERTGNANTVSNWLLWPRKGHPGQVKSLPSLHVSKSTIRHPSGGEMWKPRPDLYLSNKAKIICISDLVEITRHGLGIKT